MTGTVLAMAQQGASVPISYLAGTTFTVRASPEEGSVVVGVDEGSASVEVKDGGDATNVAAGRCA